MRTEVQERIWLLAKVDAAEQYGGLLTALGEIRRKAAEPVFYRSAADAFAAIDMLWQKDPQTATETRVFEAPIREVFELTGPFEEGLSEWPGPGDDDK